MNTRWNRTDAPRGAEYDARWTRLAAAGQNIHGEADLVETLLAEIGGTRVLDAGCGTGRVGIELRGRGFDVVGVDADPGMLETARRNAPEINWIHVNLCDLDTHLGEEFDVALLAGNVMIFVEPGTEARVLQQVSKRLTPGGVLVAGFKVDPDRLTLDDYDRFAADAGLEPNTRWATWDQAPFAGGDYAVSVHRKGT
ncbi:class I SAM-dependent DNA methyltransferase [Aldersonia kunmingensis]|uniref:class I SAM-dependent DNA methyltransferase n=1 Tax=Aldersonia kunmingensis TaxID=408066 RepID=UPI00082EE896|nr:class I SAM-dependent methyltransferase [Aldersonia kunmingensis]